jgi:hypothetical protein
MPGQLEAAWERVRRKEKRREDLGELRVGAGRERDGERGLHRGRRASNDGRACASRRAGRRNHGPIDVHSICLHKHRDPHPALRRLRDSSARTIRPGCPRQGCTGL